MNDKSEGESRTQLQIARLATARDLTEGSIRDIAVGLTEVPIVEGIEGFEAQLENDVVAENLFAVETQPAVGDLKIRC